jgi:hypothetical protein
MRSILAGTAIIFLASVFFCTVARAQKTSAAHDKNIDFSKYKTFAFDEGTARNPFVITIIVEALERELTARGLQKVSADSDLRVSYVAATVPNLQVANVPFYHVVNPAYSGMVGSSHMAMWDVTTGTLVIDLFDRQTDRVVFRGTVNEVLQRAPGADPRADAKMVSKPINKGIEKVFKKYPIKRK